MDINQCLKENRIVLTEASIVERLRRSGVSLDEHLAHALLVRDEKGREALTALYNEYITVARNANLPMLIFTPTWRASKERMSLAGIGGDLNGEAVALLQGIRDGWGDYGRRILIGGLMGCKNDCYRPEEGLDAAEAREFHRWQAAALFNGGADFIAAETLPALPEAMGMAGALSDIGIPYFISFVINRRGVILDGTSLDSAMAIIDTSVKNPPLGYMVNCAHPSFLRPETIPAAAMKRLTGYLANASSLDHEELEGSPELRADDVGQWASLMASLHRECGLAILGGCCGTDSRHLKSIVRCLQ